jgi:pSer/pThr/pTyr-binding forkhead associated (FHA) protein
MALSVVVRSGDSQTPPRITFDAPRIVVGRGEGCEVRLPDPSVSHRHATFRQRGTEYIVIDEGSTNGTFVGPVRLSPQAPRVIRSGDLVRVGRVWLEVIIEQVAVTQQPQLATTEIALSLVADALAADGQSAALTVRVEDGPDTGAEFSLREFERPYVIGRGERAALDLTDSDVSRRHVELLRRGGHLYVRDLGSKNGSRLDERALEAGQEVPWPAGAILHLGQDQLVYDDPVTRALEDLDKVADEHIREDEPVAPPDAAEPPAPASSQKAEAYARTEASRQAPIAAPPKRKRASTPRRTGWTGTDVLVALLSLAVLAASIAGLLWLFGAT